MNRTANYQREAITKRRGCTWVYAGWSVVYVECPWHRDVHGVRGMVRGVRGMVCGMYVVYTV